MMPDVSILVVSYNTRDETLACLRSVDEQTTRSTFETIVVDNDSKDGSADAIAADFPRVRLIRSAKNLGFAGANNLAAREATGEFLLLLNPDTVILDGAIDRVVGFARENPGAGAYGGRTYFCDMTLNRNSCHGRPTPWSMACKGLGLSAVLRKSILGDPEGLGGWNRDTVRTVDCVSGCFLLMRRELWERLGGFDLDFFMYGEDTDLCLRAAKLAGPCLICPDARLIHYGGRSERVRADKMVRLFRAKAQLFEKHWHPRLVPFGVLMLKSWAGSRAVGTWVATKLGADRAAAHEAWREVYRRRAEYAAGGGAAAKVETPSPEPAEPTAVGVNGG